VSTGVRKKYLAHLLKSPPMQRQFSSMIKGVAQSGLNLSDIRRIGVILPPTELQASYEQIAEKIESQVRVYRNSLTDFEALYGALSQQAFKGELDLSRVTLPPVPTEGGTPVVAAVPATFTAPVIELPETDLLLPALQNRTQLAPLLRFWLEAYRTQLGREAFSVEHFIAAAQTRLAERHPDNDFEWAVSDYETTKVWVFEALAAGALTQAFDDGDNRIELKAVAEQGLA
jgi:type I restriction enzyme, S subunit